MSEWAQGRLIHLFRKGKWRSLPPRSLTLDSRRERPQ
jgi:hypothetical protein